MTMLGLSTLSLSSSTAMVIDGKVLALAGTKTQSLSYRRDCLPMCLVPSRNQDLLEDLLLPQLLLVLLLLTSSFLLILPTRMKPKGIILSLRMQNSCWMRRSIAKNNYSKGFVTVESTTQNRISGL